MAKLRLTGDTSGFTEVSSPAVAGNANIILPSGVGQANQFLRNTGTSGTLGWSNVIETATGVGINTVSPDANLSVSGVASFAAGTSGTPSIAAFGDLNTGIYFPSADTVAFTAGGNESSRINNSGILLVGTTNANGTALVQVSGDVLVNSVNSGPLAGMRNAVINGSFAFGQRATTFVSGANNDDTYNLDRWYVLSDGNDVVDISQSTSVIPTNGKYAIALDVETVNKKFGIAQIIEADNCLGLIGETVTLSFKAKVSATTKLDNVKAAIVAWSGTADTVTSDIISAWNVEGTNPTLIADATYENTPANLNLTTSYVTYSVTAAVDTASTKNILVFIWSDVTDTTLGDFLYITDVQLERGPVATPFERRPIGTELALCQRYYQLVKGGCGVAGLSTQFYGTAPLLAQMRAAPTLGKTSGNITIGDMISADFSSSSTPVVEWSENTTSLNYALSGFTGLTTGRVYRHEPKSPGLALITCSAEL